MKGSQRKEGWQTASTSVLGGSETHMSILQSPRSPTARKLAHLSLMRLPDSPAENALSEEHLQTPRHSPTLAGSVPPASSTKPKGFHFRTPYIQVRATFRPPKAAGMGWGNPAALQCPAGLLGYFPSRLWVKDGPAAVQLLLMGSSQAMQLLKGTLWSCLQGWGGGSEERPGTPEEPQERWT